MRFLFQPLVFSGYSVKESKWVITLTTPFILSRIMLPINIKITAGYHTQCGKHGDHVIYATVYSHKLIKHPTVDAVQGHDMYDVCTVSIG